VKAKPVDKEEHGMEELTMICKGKAAYSLGTHMRVIIAMMKSVRTNSATGQTVNDNDCTGCKNP
jgi:hypothetical protein